MQAYVFLVGFGMFFTGFFCGMVFICVFASSRGGDQ